MKEKINNISYEDIEPIVEKLIKSKTRKYKFDIWGEDDIAQEIRIKCFVAIQKYDPNSGAKIETYLTTCVNNMLANLLRDNFFSCKPPCYNNRTKSACKYFSGDVSYPCDRQDSCERYAAYIKKRNSKLAFYDSKPLDLFHNYFGVKNNMSVEFFDQEIIDHLPNQKAIEYYRQYRNNEKIPYQYLAIIKKVAREVFGN